MMDYVLFIFIQWITTSITMFCKINIQFINLNYDTAYNISPVHSAKIKELKELILYLISCIFIINYYDVIQ